jgi:hypothetical protein
MDNVVVRVFINSCSSVGKDLLAYMNLIVNPLNDGALFRIFNKPARGLAQKGLQDLEKQIIAVGSYRSVGAFIFKGMEDSCVDADVVQEVRYDRHQHFGTRSTLFGSCLSHRSTDTVSIIARPHVHLGD